MIRTVVLTGGPSGGKSTLHNQIGEQLTGVYLVPETATMLLSGGFPAPSERHPWDETWQADFQVAIAAGQLAVENISKRRAEREGKSLIVLDRGRPDGAAYLPGGMREFEAITGQDERTMLHSYDMVLHMPTAAAHQAYDQSSNPHRFEEAAAALELDERIMKVWENHPNRIVLDEIDETERMAHGLRIVKGLLD